MRPDCDNLLRRTCLRREKSQTCNSGVPTGNSALPSVPAMLASLATFALEGVRSQEVTVEVDVRRGLPTFTLVGLPDAP